MIKRIKGHRMVSLIMLASFFLVIGGFFWSYGALAEKGLFAGGAEPLILHFNDMDGITSVGGLGDLVDMGILGTIIVVLNFFIATSLEDRDRTLGRVVAGATLAIAILLFLAFAAIMNVN